MLAPGTVLGRYEILRLISVGGMAEIYLARAEGIAGFEKRVVLKRMLPHFASQPAYVQMFLAEARLSANLDHPNVVQVHDIGETTGDYYYAMEYVAGVDLREVVQAERRAGRQVPIPIVTAIGRGICAGLEAAHSLTNADGQLLGVVHRDVSLSNVLVSYAGSVKVTDFGVAKINAASSQTRVGTLKGKIGYMSPEQCRGEHLDRRSDIFSIGIILYEMLVAERLFGGDTEFQILQRIIDGKVTPPTELRPEVPRLLEAIVMRALRVDRAERYQTAHDLQRDLETFARNERLAIGSIELGEYMSELFPVENRHGRSMGGGTKASAVIEDGADDFSVEVEIVEDEKKPAKLPPRHHNVIAAPDSFLRSNKQRVRMVAVAGGVLLAAMIMGFLGGRTGRNDAVTSTESTVARVPATIEAPATVAVPAPAGAPAPAAARPGPATMPANVPPTAIAEDSADAAAADIIDERDGRDADERAGRIVAERERPASRVERDAPVRGKRLAAAVANRDNRDRPGAHAGAGRAPASHDEADEAAPAPAPAAVANAPSSSPDAGPTVANAPVPSPPPAPVPQTARAATPRPVPPAKDMPGSLDAVPSIGSLDVSGALQSSVIRRGVERALPGLRECYRIAARGAKKTPPVSIRLTFEIGESGLARNVKAGETPLPGMARCVQDASARIRSTVTPDVGVAHASVLIKFAPISP